MSNRRRERPCVTMWTQAKVDTKDSFGSRFNEIHEVAYKRLEKIGGAWRVVNEQQFQIGRVSHLAPTKLAKRANGKPRGRSIVAKRRAPFFSQPPIAFKRCLVDD